ncbi:MAG: DUF2652 domain-containing protein [Actinobacteria bacterium]|nr:DUF2652 domain-containing protein [Actinomycetota bacterium]
MAATEPACLIIADISGYTDYLAGVELDHAQDILADLMNTVVKALRPSFKLAKLEGDAAFVYALTDDVDGSLLLDTAENCYFAFRNRLLSIRQSSTCECNACAMIPSLNLKMVAHHGEVATHKIAGHTELVGNDVVVVHRLLKNSIPEAAYLFVTTACVERTTLDPEALGFRRHVESYEHLGVVEGWVEDLELAWEAYRNRTAHYVSPVEAGFALSGFVPALPELVWEFISSPVLRPQWALGMTSIDQVDPGGRRRPGTLNHCMHGKDVILQEFIDWRPPRYYTSSATVPGGVKLISTHEVEGVEGGSMIHDRFRQPKGKEAQQVFDQLRVMFEAGHDEELARLRELVIARQSELSADSEPELRVPNEANRLATSVMS